MRKMVLAVCAATMVAGSADAVTFALSGYYPLTLTANQVGTTNTFAVVGVTTTSSYNVSLFNPATGFNGNDNLVVYNGSRYSLDFNGLSFYITYPNDSVDFIDVNIYTDNLNRSYAYTQSPTTTDTNQIVASISLINAPLMAPEPASWAMMIVGLGAIGATMRRRKVAVSFAG